MEPFCAELLTQFGERWHDEEDHAEGEHEELTKFQGAGEDDGDVRQNDEDVEGYEKAPEDFHCRLLSIAFEHEIEVKHPERKKSFSNKRNCIYLESVQKSMKNGLRVLFLFVAFGENTERVEQNPENYAHCDVGCKARTCECPREYSCS